MGRYNKELVIRLFKHKVTKQVLFILARRRSRPNSRYDVVGFFDVIKSKKKVYNVIGLNLSKIRTALSLGVQIHIGVYKLLFP